MTKNTIELTAENFDEKTANGRWVVDFWAEWCGPCRMMAPEFEAAAAEEKGINFGKVDVDSQQALAEKYSIVSIPTMIFFKDGKQVNQLSGAMPKGSIIEAAKKSF